MGSKLDSVELYAAAHDAHYRTKDLRVALDLYRGVLATCPSTREAEHSRTQIHNMVRSVVPGPDLLAALIALIQAHIGHEGQPEKPGGQELSR